MGLVHDVGRHGGRDEAATPRTERQGSDRIRRLPGKKSYAGRTAADNRLFVEAVAFVLKTGIPWAHLPGCCGKQIQSRMVRLLVCRGRVGTPGQGLGRPGLGSGAVRLDDSQGPRCRPTRLARLPRTPGQKGGRPRPRHCSGACPAAQSGARGRRRGLPLGRAAAKCPPPAGPLPHRTRPDSEADKALRPKAAQTPRRDRAVFLPAQAVPSGGKRGTGEKAENLVGFVWLVAFVTAEE